MIKRFLGILFIFVLLYIFIFPDAPKKAKVLPQDKRPKVEKIVQIDVQMSVETKKIGPSDNYEILLKTNMPKKTAMTVFIFDYHGVPTGHFEFIIAADGTARRNVSLKPDMNRPKTNGRRLWAIYRPMSPGPKIKVTGDLRECLGSICTAELNTYVTVTDDAEIAPMSEFNYESNRKEARDRGEHCLKRNFEHPTITRQLQKAFWWTSVHIIEGAATKLEKNGQHPYSAIYMLVSPRNRQGLRVFASLLSSQCTVSNLQFITDSDLR